MSTALPPALLQCCRWPVGQASWAGGEHAGQTCRGNCPGGAGADIWFPLSASAASPEKRSAHFLNLSPTLDPRPILFFSSSPHPPITHSALSEDW